MGMGSEAEGDWGVTLSGTNEELDTMLFGRAGLGAFNFRFPVMRQSAHAHVPDRG